MDVRLLGPLEAWHFGASLDLGTPKQRALLAVLAIDRGTAVSIDRLVDGLWQGQPPASSAKSIQVYVSKLRKVLGVDRLLTRGEAYVLVLSPDETDVGRFERLVRQAELRSQEGDRSRASVMLRNALSEWRGPALVDFAYDDFAQAEIARLDELRLHATELGHELDVGLGQAAQVLPDLEASVAANPYREGLRSLLMIALYQVGRQADALSCYRQGRTLLAHELGLEPGPRLQALEHAILVHDAAVLGTSGAASEIPAAFSMQRKLISALHVALEPASAEPELGTVALARAEAIVAEEIARAGGRAEHLAGFGMAGIFGVPIAWQDHAARAIDAAIASLARLSAGEATGVEGRAGIESGEVIVDSDLEHPGVIGSAPAVAARVAYEAAPGEIAVGSRAAATAGDRFELGLGKSVRFGGGFITFRPVVARGQHATRRRGAFVGREAEVADIIGIFRGVAAARSPRLVAVVGEPGIGKTRLLEAVQLALGADPSPPTWLTGRCVAYGHAQTYAAAAEILRQLLDLSDSADQDGILERLAPRTILGLTLGFDVAAGLHPLTARDRLQLAWVEVVQERVRQGPLVLVIEDLHWAEGPLLELLDRLTESISGPLLVLATARPELLDRSNDWIEGRASHSAHWLEPLGPVASRGIAAEHLGGDAPAEVDRLVLDRAEGNPFFIEELLDGLLDRGAIERDARGWQLRPDRIDSRPPDSVQGSVAGRVDLLPARPKAVLQAAAVVGRSFPPAAVEALVGPCDAAIDVLVRRDFIQSDPTSSVESPRFRFKHAITRDVAYGGLPRARRAHLHASVADWLLADGGGRDEDAARLADHLSVAANPDDVQLAWPERGVELERITALALTWLERAADLAVSRHEVAAGTALFEQALRLSPVRDTEARLWRKLAAANVVRYDGPGFWTAMERALAVSDSDGDRADLYASLAEVTAIRRWMWREIPPSERLHGWIDRALEIAAEGTTARARALVARAWISPWGPGRTADIERAAELTRDIDDRPLRAHVAALEARNAIVGEEFAEARDGTARLLGLLEGIDNPDERAVIHQIGIPMLASCGQLVDAELLAVAFEALTRTLSAHHQLHAVASLLDLRVLRGDPQGVLDLVGLVRRRVTANRATACFNGPRALLICAAVAAGLGDDDLASSLEDQADSLGMVGYELDFSVPRARLAIARGQHTTARRELAGSLSDRLNPWLLPAVVPEYLDGLVAIEEHGRLETETVPYLNAGSVFEPFALRALGIARHDEAMLARAQRRFRELGLLWHSKALRRWPAGPGIVPGRG
jgi:DNA-binding SARP family transcriptional activator